MHTNKTERLTVEHTEKKYWDADKRRFAGKGQIKEINSNG
jgi:hypothetical protein